MIKVEIIHLETLLWIHKLGTFAAAADRLNTTQPAISLRIREMENRLGVSLFKRQGRRMVLTARGRNLIEQCEPLLNQLRYALLATDGFSMSEGNVRMGVGEIAALSCMPPCLAALKKQMPGVTFEIDVDLTINLQQKIAAGNLDLAVLVGPVTSPYMRSTLIGPVPMRWMCNRSMKEEIEQQGLSSHDVLNRLPFWCLSRPSHLYEMMLSMIRAKGGSTKNINTCNHVKALIETVSAGAGIGILPEPLARHHIHVGNLAEIDVGIPIDPIEFFAVMPSSEEDPLLNEIFMRISKIRIDT
ncbi:LysR family transcriptional regulator [Alcaligenaceae bacterium]|nr:LysR family transcriptional regulator [Alcaligenaceae bacterium]